MSNTFDKLSVLDPFIEEVNSYLPEIEANLERLAQAPDDMDALEETYRRTHTIGGSASMMDFPGLSHVAHGMEDILGDALESLITLDASTLALLRRSLARVRVLLNGIRSGVNEAPILAEDDADYEQYRALLAASSQNLVQAGEPAAPAASAPLLATTYAPFEQSSSSPSFDEVLASFQSPSHDADEVVWPEEAPLSAPLAYDERPASALSTGEPFAAGTAHAAQSALDELVASVSQSLPAVPPDAATNAARAARALHSGRGIEVPGPARISLGVDRTSAQAEQASPRAETVADRTQIVPSAQTMLLPEAYIEAQHEAQMLVAHVESLTQIVAQLHAAIATIEGQRSEFKGFLDGSKDALERMEDWAGRAMGLNLRNSPEQVRRYLPLSVMWVSNTKLKKVQDVLHQIASGVELTDEQVQGILQQLQTTLIACGEAFQQMQQRTQQGTGHLLRQEPQWASWEMQPGHQSTSGHIVRERVTFERRGDLAALRAEMEAQLRAELQREYETRSMTLAARAELEQQIRKEVRQEFEARRHLQSETAGGENRESRAELEARLRSEIELQVRRDFLDTITSGGGDVDTFLRPASPPVTSNFVDRAREATGTLDQSAPGAQGAQNDSSASQLQQKTKITPVPTSQSAMTGVPLPTTQLPVGPVSSFPSMSATSSVQRFSSGFGEEASEVFRIEAEEHLQSISMHVAALEKSPANRELIQGIRRATHTLKGAAGMMGFRAIADLSHISEDLLDSIMAGTTPISPAVLSIILDTAETLDSLITGKGADTAGEAARVQALRVRYTALLGERAAVSHDEEESDAEAESNEKGAAETKVVASMPGEEEVEAQRTAPGDLSVRVRLQKLDELVNLFGELLVNRSVLEERLQRMARIVADVSLSSNRLRDVGQKLESNFEAATLPSGRAIQVMPGDGDQSNTSLNGNGFRIGENGVEPSHLAEFDELELDRYTEFHRLARGLSEGISDMTTLSTEMETVIREAEGVFSRENRLSTTFQDRLMKVRLVPLSTMAPRLYRAARAVALKQHKDFEFLLEGEETEVDRTVYEEIAGPLLHLMRNAVNHAIETPEVRVQKGKPPTGEIKLSAAYEGNQVVITVRDDGTGIDPERVRNTAIARGLISPEQVLSENDLIELIFRPGFSTAEVVSEESGRGVGLDVVRDSVSRFRGTIEVESTPGQGTAFTMKFPTSLAIQSAMMVGVNGQQFAVPTVMVESIGRLDTLKRATVASQQAVVVRNDLYPLHMLSQYLSFPSRPLDEKAQLLLINAGGQRVALIVDEIKGKMDVVMKSLGPHLRNVRGIAGGTVLGNGQVVLILELLELLEMRSKVSVRHESPAQPSAQQMSQMPIKQLPGAAANRQAASPASPASMVPASASAPVAERGKYILVVDDSPSVRRVVSNMLKQNRWEVQMARDGVEALEIIAQETPAAVLLDIEMPRMDGYELIATVRAQEQYRTLPLVVLTSRAASKHQQRAMQLGASAYVVKPYQDEELLRQLNTLVYGTAAR